MHDLALARRVLDGDESAAEEFFAEYFPRVYRFARLRLGGADDAAEEVAQATLIRAIRKLHTYRGEAALFTWLCTLCRQEIDLWRQRAGRVDELELVEEHPDIRQALDAVARTAADPERLAGRRELAALVHLTLDQLPARYGQALEWKYLEGHTTEEIARRLGIGYKAAESLLTRAREAFRHGFALIASEAS
jgi:RNA polymerase sigma-70 factor, ECF subfamily